MKYMAIYAFIKIDTEIEPNRRFILSFKYYGCTLLGIFLISFTLKILFILGKS